MQLPPVATTVAMPLIELKSVDSTNNYALDQIHANLAQPGYCYFAHEQTAGKGQRGKSWATEKDSDIAMSIVLQPQPLLIFQQFRISACVAVATYDFLLKYAGRQLRIKWPNDLYWKKKKLGGILIENVVRSKGSGVITWDWSVAGIGINVNRSKFPEELKNAISLSQIRRQKFDRIYLAEELCRSVDHYYRLLMTNGFASILDRYNAVLYKKDKLVKLKKANRVFETRIKSVSETGQLITQHAIEERFDFGEVEWLL